MALIDKTYFVGEINIPDTGNPAVAEKLNLFIEKYEKEFLLTAMGLDLYTAYADGIVQVTPDQKWLDIRDGSSYIVNDTNYKWEGLRAELIAAVTGPPATPAIYKSPIANYVYYWWTRFDSKAKPDDAEQQRAYYEWRSSQMCRAWNEMAEQVRSLTFFLNQNTAVYPEWTTFNWYITYYSYSMWDLMRPINSMNL